MANPDGARRLNPLRNLFASQQGGLVLVILLLGTLLTVLAGSHIDSATGRTVNNFLNSYTLIQTATDTSFFAIMAVGATVVIISGGIDLSVGSIYALAGVATAMVLRAYGPAEGAGAVAVGFAVAMTVGLACGAVNGLMVVWLNVHPFVITLGTMWILRGIAWAERVALSRADAGHDCRDRARRRLPPADGDGPSRVCRRRQRRSEPVFRPLAPAH